MCTCVYKHMCMYMYTCVHMHEKKAVEIVASMACEKVNLCCAKRLRARARSPRFAVVTVVTIVMTICHTLGFQTLKRIEPFSCRKQKVFCVVFTLQHGLEAGDREGLDAALHRLRRGVHQILDLL